MRPEDILETEMEQYYNSYPYGLRADLYKVLV